MSQKTEFAADIVIFDKRIDSGTTLRQEIENAEFLANRIETLIKMYSTLDPMNLDYSDYDSVIDCLDGVISDLLEQYKYYTFELMKLRMLENLYEEEGNSIFEKIIFD